MKQLPNRNSKKGRLIFAIFLVAYMIYSAVSKLDVRNEDGLYVSKLEGPFAGTFLLSSFVYYDSNDNAEKWEEMLASRSRLELIEQCRDQTVNKQLSTFDQYTLENHQVPDPVHIDANKVAVVSSIIEFTCEDS